MKIIVSDYSGHPFQVQLSRELARRGHQVKHLHFAEFQTPKGNLQRQAADPATFDIEIWGDGQQTRSFLYIDECIEGTIRLTRSDCTGPFNIGSDEMVTISGLVDMASDVANKPVGKRYIPGPTGVRGRNSDNRLIEKELGWRPSQPLRDGLALTYAWIDQQVAAQAAAEEKVG